MGNTRHRRPALPPLARSPRPGTCRSETKGAKPMDWPNEEQRNTDAWLAIQNAVSVPVSSIRTGLTTEWEIIQTFMSEKQTAIQTAVETAWSAIQGAIST